MRTRSKRSVSWSGISIRLFTRMDRQIRLNLRMAAHKQGIPPAAIIEHAIVALIESGEYAPRQNFRMNEKYQGCTYTLDGGLVERLRELCDENGASLQTMLHEAITRKLNISVSRTNSTSRSAASPQVKSFAALANALDLQTGRENLFEFSERVNDVLGCLSAREEMVLRLRFGLGDGYPRTLEETGSIWDISRERIRQIETRALKKILESPAIRQLKSTGYPTVVPSNLFFDEVQGIITIRSAELPACFLDNIKDVQSVECDLSYSANPAGGGTIQLSNIRRAQKNNALRKEQQ